MLKFIKKTLSNRAVVGGSLMLIQLVILLAFLFFLSDLVPILYPISQIISILIVIWLVRKEDNPSYKISWIILIFSVPPIGGLFYLFWGNNPFNVSRMIKLKQIDRKLFKIDDLPICGESASFLHKNHLRISNYINKTGGYPLFENDHCEYFSTGEDFFSSLVENLKKAQKYIFMEYFIVESGIMWDSILDILKEKVSQGVEVRFMYDDAGCLSTLPSSYHDVLQDFGIKCIRFNRFRPSLNTYLNNRDHRKITVIDGKIGFMGGANLADEYINERLRFGHWKDTAILINGNAVSSLTIMFLDLWEFISEQPSSDYTQYIEPNIKGNNGYIQPFSDNPLDNYNVGENVYMQILNTAKKYVYITTPYLILDNEMVTALIIAAQSGIDVKIITPHIPDKKYVHAVTRSFYAQLISAGVEIYEYTPGFIHAKVILSDDNIGIVGTINMDFRSFYMHFECGAVLYDCPVLTDIKTDLVNTLSISQKIALSNLRKTPKIMRLMYSILRIFSPMM